MKKKMNEIKIIAFTSSPNRNGNSIQLTRAMLKQIEKHGAQTEEIYLPDYNLDLCHGCMACLRKERCVYPDDLNYLINQIVEADGIIMASPTYATLPNALMINFMQRAGMYNAYRSAFRNKYIVGIATAGGIGAKKCATFLVEFLDSLFSDGNKVGTLGMLISRQDMTNAIEKAKILGDKMIQAIYTQKRYPFQNFIGKILRELFLKRIMMKNLELNKEGFMAGVYQYVMENHIISKI